jgi:hypothetical protein
MSLDLSGISVRIPAGNRWQIPTELFDYSVRMGLLPQSVQYLRANNCKEPLLPLGLERAREKQLLGPQDGSYM